jgi:hypothetical protein
MTPNIRPRWENAYSIVDPQINAEGIHLWPFDLSFPVDVRFFSFNKRASVSAWKRSPKRLRQLLKRRRNRRTPPAMATRSKLHLDRDTFVIKVEKIVIEISCPACLSCASTHSPFKQLQAPSWDERRKYAALSTNFDCCRPHASSVVRGNGGAACHGEHQRQCY